MARLRGERTPAEVAADVCGRMSRERDFLTTTLPRLAAGDWRDARCVFVPSTGRAGSMQLAAVLGLAPEVIALHEPTPMLLDLGAEAYAEHCAGDAWRCLARGIRNELVAFAAHENRIYVETNNRLTFIAQALADVYPASRFIHLHRHPYEVVRSGLSRRWYEGSAVDFSLIRPRPGDPYAGRWGTMTAAEKIAWFWLRINEEASAFVAGLGPRGMVLGAAEFFACEAQTISRLFEFVGVPAPDLAAVRQALGRQLNATRGGTAKQATADVHPIRAIVAPLAEQLGYEL
jgi:hypothetical protein